MKKIIVLCACITTQLCGSKASTATTATNAGAAAATAAAASAKAEQNEAALTLINGSKQSVSVDRDEAKRVSGLIRTALENDADAAEVDIPDSSATKEVLAYFKRILPALAKLQSETHPDEHAAYTPEELMVLTPQIVELIEKDMKAAYPKEANDSWAIGARLEFWLPRLMNFANYIDAPALLDAVVHKYVEMLAKYLDFAQGEYPVQIKPEHEDWVKSRKLSQLPKVIREKISQQFFLQHQTDIDHLLGLQTRTTIPVATLIAYGYIPDFVVKEFPNLVTSPNEIRETLYSKNKLKKITALGLLISKSHTLPSDDVNRFVKGMLRIRHIDPNIPITGTMTPLGVLAFITDGIYPALEELLRAGAKANLADSQGWTPLMRAGQSIHANKIMINLLIKNGASLDDAIARLTKKKGQEPGADDALEYLERYKKDYMPH